MLYKKEIMSYFGKNAVDLIKKKEEIDLKIQKYWFFAKFKRKFKYVLFEIENAPFCEKNQQITKVGFCSKCDYCEKISLCYLCLRNYERHVLDYPDNEEFITLI